MRCDSDLRKERLETVPTNSHSDAYHDKRRQPHHDHGGVADSFARPLRVAIRQKDRQRNDAGALRQVIQVAIKANAH